MKSVASRLAYEVRPFQDEDTSQVLNLLTLVLGSGLVGERSAAFFRWKHVHNPFGRSFMLVADGGGRIIGFRAFMRWQFLGAEGGLRAVQAVDTATHPDFQRQGVFSRLTKAALSILRGEADLVFNTPNDNSGPAYLKLGWTKVGRLPVTMQARHPLRLVSCYLVDRPATNQPTPAIDAPSAATVLQTESEQIGALLAEAEAPIDRIRTRRSLDFLRWRYSTTPNLEYRAITEHRNGRLSGLVIFRVRPRGALWENWVVELIVPPGNRETATSLLRQVRQAAPVDNLRGIFPRGTSAAQAAWRLGFIRTRFGIPLFTNPLGRIIRPYPGVMESWALSLGDLEIF